MSRGYGEGRRTGQSRWPTPHAGADGGEPMTEKQWLKWTNPHTLLSSASESIPRRKLLLLATACSRRAWQWVPTDTGDDLLCLLESMAEPHGTPTEHGAMQRALDAVRLAFARADRVTSDRIRDGSAMRSSEGLPTSPPSLLASTPARGC